MLEGLAVLRWKGDFPDKRNYKQQLTTTRCDKYCVLATEFHTSRKHNAYLLQYSPLKPPSHFPLPRFSTLSKSVLPQKQIIRHRHLDKLSQRPPHLFAKLRQQLLLLFVHIHLLALDDARRLLNRGQKRR